MVDPWQKHDYSCSSMWNDILHIETLLNIDYHAGNKINVSFAC